MRSTVLCAAVWGFALAASGPAQGLPAPAAAAAQEPRRVVILNEADPTLPAFVLVDRGIRAVLADPNRPRVDIFYEVLDMLRFPGAERQFRQQRRGCQQGLVAQDPDIAGMGHQASPPGRAR